MRSHAAATRFSRVPAVLLLAAAVALTVLGAFAANAAGHALEQRRAALRVCAAPAASVCSEEIHGTFELVRHVRKSADVWALVAPGAGQWRFRTRALDFGDSAGMIRVYEGAVVLLRAEDERWHEPSGVGRGRAVLWGGLAVAALGCAVLACMHSWRVVRRKRSLLASGSWQPRRADGAVMVVVALAAACVIGSWLGLPWWAAALIGGGYVVRWTWVVVADLRRQMRGTST